MGWTYYFPEIIFRKFRNVTLFFRIRIFEFYLTFKKARLFSVLERIKHVWFCKRVITKGLISKRLCLDHGEVWTISIGCRVINLVRMQPIPTSLWGIHIVRTIVLRSWSILVWKRTWWGGGRPYPYILFWSQKGPSELKGFFSTMQVEWLNLEGFENKNIW